MAYDAGGQPEPPERAPGRWAAPAGAAARVAALLIVLVVAGITYLVLVRVPPAPAAPAAPSAEPEPPGVVATAEPSGGDAAVLVVHVAGAVLEPGVVEVPAGTRVAEAIEVAGGPADDADLDALNLASPVVDGQQVYVPREGESMPPTASGGTGADASQPGGGLVNINTADAVALEALPGIGPALSSPLTIPLCPDLS